MVSSAQRLDVYVRRVLLIPYRLCLPFLRTLISSGLMQPVDRNTHLSERRPFPD